MTTEPLPPPPDPAITDKVKPLFDRLPEDFDRRLSFLRSIREAFYLELAAAMEPSLNEHAKSLPQNTHEEKAWTATAINAMLRSLGLTIRDPQGRQALLIVDNVGNDRADLSRFRLQSVDSDGRVHRPISRAYLPELSLMMFRPREDHWSRRRDQPRPRER